MYNILNFYYKNRIKIWAIIIAIVLGWIMLQVLNNSLKTGVTNDNNIDKETTSNNVVSYHNESESIVSGENVSSSYGNQMGEVINQFFTHCINHEYSKAYDMVSNDTKKILYTTIEIFKKNYCKKRFEGNKEFSFQSWSSSNGIYIYQIKIFENMISTGKTNDTYIEEYVTITVEQGNYKLNLNSYIGREEINKTSKDDNLVVQAVRVDRYLDYEVYTLNIQNNTDKTIILDTRRDTDTCYVEDNKGNKFEAILYENKEEDLEFKPKEFKTIQIKFNDAYRSGLEINSINFIDIVDKEEYEKNNNIQSNSFKVELN